MNTTHPQAAPPVEMINYANLADLDLVTIITPEFKSGTPIRIYRAIRKDQVKEGDIAYRRNVHTKTSIFYQVVTADSVPYPSPRCSVICHERPYQLFLRLSRVRHQPDVDQMNEELEAAIALPY